MNSDQKNIVIGTAGHVGHGKTTLIKVLTGIDTDRLKEEKERGMTIEPGFACLKLPSGKIVSVVDVPEDERFIRNMLRGISEVDAVILVVAADDGVMPQTREHLDILRLLNIERGLIVLSKIDLVDKEILDMAIEDVARLVEGTILKDAPLILCSSKTGEGIAHIKTFVENLTEEVLGKDGKSIVVHKTSHENLREEVLEKLRKFHEENSVRDDISQEEIRSEISSSIDIQLFEGVLRELYKDGMIVRRKGKIKLARSQRTLNPKQKLIYDQLDGACKLYRFRPLPINVFKEIKDCHGDREVEIVLKLMMGEGRLIKLNNHRLIHSESIEEIKRILKGHIEKRGQVVLGESMEVLGVGRAQAQPIFDYLDSIRFTMRIGDYRILHRMSERNDEREAKSTGVDIISNPPCSNSKTVVSRNGKEDQLLAECLNKY